MCYIVAHGRHTAARVIQSTAKRGSALNENPGNKSGHVAAPKKAKPFFPPGSTGASTMRLRAELQHEEAKLRIFKIFIVLFVLCVGAFLVYSAFAYVSESKAKAERLDAARQKLAELESGLTNASLTPYQRAELLVRVLNARRESVMPLLSRDELHAAEQGNVRIAGEIENLAKIELPAEPGQPGTNFIQPSAHLDMVGSYWFKGKDTSYGNG